MNSGNMTIRWYGV